MYKLKFKIKPILASGLLAIFLFGLNFLPAQAGGQIVRVNFKLSDPDKLALVESQFGISNVKTVFSNSTLGFVYSGDLSDSNLELLRTNRYIEYVNVDETIRVSDLTITNPITANDPFFTTDSKNTDKQWYLEKTHVPEAWNITTGSGTVTVAILDTGIHATHLDLNDGRVGLGYNSIKQQVIQPNTNSDDNGHGTLVAGVIGGVTNNTIGISGINWSVHLMPVKALDSIGNGTISDISAGIVWATDNGANIINMSLGGSGFPEDQTLASAITYAFNKGVLLVSAAGNDLANLGKNLDTNPVYPVCADNGANMILGVAASDVSDVKAAFSNFGINCVDITAPGVRILTTAFFPSDPSDNVLVYADGTSLSAPIVSGIAALIKSAHPNLNNIQIRDLILNSADDISASNQNNCMSTSCNGFLGHGRINALAALTPKPIIDGTVLREPGTGKFYMVMNKTKQSISPFVFNQRGFNSSQVVDDTNNTLTNLLIGSPLPPVDGTLVKSNVDPTVYVMNGGAKRPLTYLVFTSRGYSFADVVTLSAEEVGSITTSDWYWPPDGTLVLIKGNPTVYVMDKQVVRAVTYFVFTQRKLSFTKVISVTADEFSHVPKAPDSFWLAPLDGTLVKSNSGTTVYVIEGSAKHAISGAQFSSRKYKFSAIKVLPQAELDVIAPGEPIL